MLILSQPPPESHTAALTRGHFNDLNQGLAQQMFFWGRDVLTGGNLLLRHGFEKRPSPGLQGTSCYCRRWQHGTIELHGACAGWYPIHPDHSGFLFIRSDRRCYSHHETSPAVPGRYNYEKLQSGDLTGLTLAGRTFAAWLVEYEQWIASEMGPAYRRGCFDMHAHLPASRPWLQPEAALRWITLFATSTPPRVRKWRTTVNA